MMNGKVHTSLKTGKVVNQDRGLVRSISDIKMRPKLGDWEVLQRSEQGLQITDQDQVMVSLKESIIDAFNKNETEIYPVSIRPHITVYSTYVVEVLC